MKGILPVERLDLEPVRRSRKVLTAFNKNMKQYKPITKVSANIFTFFQSQKTSLIRCNPIPAITAADVVLIYL